MVEKTYLCIDLKSFYASCECVERGLDSLSTNLVVADPSRGQGAICLAVSPSLKKLGVRNRCRLFEIPSNINYITALPRMNLYIEYSATIYGIYLKYISKDDIFVYSIDECFLDVTNYLHLYKKDKFELAKIIIDDIKKTTGIIATAGIGTNLFLAKVALDIMAKHATSNIGYLDEMEFKRSIWHHRPITDIWQVGNGIARRLEKLGLYDLYDVANENEDKLYKEFGVNAQFLIEHSKGIEPCTISQIHNYKPQGKSLSNGQILFKPYSFMDAKIVLKEMVDIQVRDMVGNHLACSAIYLGVGYQDKRSTSGSLVLNETTNSYKKLVDYFIQLYDKKVKKDVPIRQIHIGFGNLVDEDFITYDLFSDVVLEEKEKKIQLTMLDIQKKFGKNSILKGMNYQKKSTQRLRNKLVGGHNAN